MKNNKFNFTLCIASLIVNIIAVSILKYTNNYNALSYFVGFLVYGIYGYIYEKVSQYLSTKKGWQIFFCVIFSYVEYSNYF